MSNKTIIVGSVPFCTDDSRFSGFVEVVEIELDHARKTIGLRLRVGSRFVHIPRHRTHEVIAAMQAASMEASAQYTKIITEMNHG